MKHHSNRISARRLRGDTSSHSDRSYAGSGEGESPVFQLEWPVFEYEIVERDDGDVFRVRGYVEEKELRAEPSHVPVPTKTYDPVTHADEILTHATRLDTKDTKSLLEFVNQWGLLGWEAEWGGLVSDLIGPYLEAVVLTRNEIEDVKRMAEELWVLQRGRPRSEDATWEEFADDLNERLLRTQPVVRVQEGGRGLRMFHRPDSLLDVLALALLDRAVSVTRQRRCPECGSYFVPTRRNQHFCKRGGEPYCVRKRALRTWRRRQKRRRRPLSVKKAR